MLIPQLSALTLFIALAATTAIVTASSATFASRNITESNILETWQNVDQDASVLFSGTDSVQEHVANSFEFDGDLSTCCGNGCGLHGMPCCYD